MSFLSKLLRQPAPVAGDYLSIRYEGVQFCIAKVLVVEPSIVHLRIYKNKFPERPENVDESALELGTIHDVDGFGVGHVPLSSRDFLSLDPEFIKHGAVLKAELGGYEYWKEVGGGVWDLNG